MIRDIFIFAGITGCVAKTFVGLLDRVKILFQTKSPIFVQYSGKIKLVFQNLGKFNIVFDAIKTNLQRICNLGIFWRSLTLLRIFSTLPYNWHPMIQTNFLGRIVPA